MSLYDYAVIGIYLCFIASLGWVFRKFSKDSSDFFRGGGNILWWLAGATAFMSQFSAWTFTGAAGYAYTNGTMIMIIFFGNALGYFIAYFWSASKFRSMRVVTPMEAVRDRFGKFNEQFFTWVWIPIGITYAGIWLNAIAAFVSVVFGMDLILTIVVLGMVVLLVASLGGSWAVVASDFMQMMILVVMSLVAAFLAIQAVGGGDFFTGASEFMGKLPAQHLDWTILIRPEILFFWIIAALLKQVCTVNNLNDSNRFLFAKDAKNAKNAALLAGILFTIGPITWFIPPMAAAILYPDLHVFPELRNLANINDGAYVVIGLKTMPLGMIGLMVSAIFSATMSSMDAGLNKNAGIFIRNFYKPVLRKHASEKEYLIAGKLTSFVFGILVILAAIGIATVSDIGLFNVMMLFSSMVAIPFVIPLIWGIIIKKTPAWSGWTTVVVGFLSSYLTLEYLNPEVIRNLIGLDSSFKSTEISEYRFFISFFMNAIIGSLWFLGSAYFAKYNKKEFADREEKFFAQMNDPVITNPDETKAMDKAQLKTLGKLAIPYGGFVVLMALIPNSLNGRLCFLFAGGFILIIGMLLRWKGNKILDIQQQNEKVLTYND